MARLDQPRLRDFLRYLRESPKPLDALEVGWRVFLSPAQQRIAAEMNRLYSGLLWGYCDNSYVSRIDFAERRLLGKWLHNTTWGANVLEVGCGSGRLTSHLSTLVTDLTAIERERPAVIRTRTRVPARRGISVKCVDLLSFTRTENFTCVLLMENILGMNPEREQRMRLINRASELLKPGGILIIGLRVMPQRGSSESFYQAIPYVINAARGRELEIIGVVVAWSVRGFLREFQSSQSRFRIIHSAAGSARRVGGKMQYLIAEKCLSSDNGKSEVTGDLDY
jgi:SAM-dependent methyltransferase